MIQAQCLSLIANAVRNKLAPFVAGIIPVLHKQMMEVNAAESLDEENELSEACLTAIHSIIYACPSEIKSFVADLYASCMELAVYDPNYNYEEEDEVMKQADEEDAWGSDYDEEIDQVEVNVNEDSSWKVRRGAIRVMDAVIVTRQEFHLDIISNYGVRMAERFKERVDLVKCDLFEAFKALVINQSTGTETEKKKRQTLLPITEQILKHIVKQS